MATLDNLVVTTALPVIREHLHAGLSGLEWTVNAYTLTFAVLLLTGAVLGDRFGRRRMFLAGLAVFTVASAAAALSPSIGWLVAARAVQGSGAALIMPLSLTLLSAAVPPERRNRALGLWGAVGGLAVAAGPLIGGAVTTGWSWQSIFWINVPVGVVLLALARWRLGESFGPRQPLDVGGVALATVGLLGIVLGLVRADAHGWTSAGVLASFVVGAVALGAFVVWEWRSEHPMLPLRLFGQRAFAAVNAVSLLMSFGMFGAIFFLSQFLQFVQHYSPLQAGLRVLPWTAMPMLVAPIAARLADRFGGRPVLATGLALQAAGLAMLALRTSPTVPYGELWMAFVISGLGMALFFVPLASVVLSSVRPEQEGIASGTNGAFRELGGVLGIATLGAVFSARGSYASGASYVAGLTPAIWVGVAVLVVGVGVALLLPRRIGARRAAGPDGSAATAPPPALAVAGSVSMTSALDPGTPEPHALDPVVLGGGALPGGVSGADLFSVDALSADALSTDALSTDALSTDRFDANACDAGAIDTDRCSSEPASPGAERFSRAASAGAGTARPGRARRGARPGPAAAAPAGGGCGGRARPGRPGPRRRRRNARPRR
jgi:EmrB/QacA subfamily drug resistance transporter